MRGGLSDLVAIKGGQVVHIEVKVPGGESECAG